jgi:hypothetical protein
LLKELKGIYPISATPTTFTYTIRGLPLPLDPANAPPREHDDETIASALGYLAHLLFLLAKYLGVPLRYALDCRASRSLIRDTANPLFAFGPSSAVATLPGVSSGGGSNGGGGDGPSPSSAGGAGANTPEAAALQAAVTFPLFKRGVEKERFEWAVHLLRRDVLQLLWARGVPSQAVVTLGGDGASWHLLQAVEALVAHELRRGLGVGELSSVGKEEE